MDITDIDEIDQYLGSIIPAFTSSSATNQSEVFVGPLFRIVEVTGADSPGEPLPRLLINFFNEFNRTRQLLQGPNLIFWASNRINVVQIVQRYIHRSENNPHYCLHRRIRQVRRITINCYCCTDWGPCLLCEFNTQSIAFLFRIERSRIRAIQQVTQVFGQRVQSYFETAVISSVVDYLTGGSDLVERSREITLHQILFVQDALFAPEIHSIITRRQFITWATAVEERRLRPFRQPNRINGRQPGSDALWPFGAYILRAYPVCSLDNRWIGPFTEPDARIPHFLQSEAFSRGDYNLRPSPRTILDNRNRNRDWWVADYPESVGSEFLDYDSHWFGLIALNQDSDEDEEHYHSLADQTSDELSLGDPDSDEEN
jgi:hypothetical protein